MGPPQRFIFVGIMETRIVISMMGIMGTALYRDVRRVKAKH